MIPVRVVLVILASGCCLVKMAASADPPPADSNPLASPLRYRRLLVAEELIPSRFPGHRPMKRDVFFSEIERVNARASLPTQTTAQIVRASYRARLVGSELLTGEARLTVARTIEEPAVLALAPCSIVVGNLQWEDRSSVAIPSGTTESGEWMALVDRDGTMAFPWSARGESEHPNGSTFALGLPRSAATQLILELPSGVTPVVDRGVVMSKSTAQPSVPSGTNGLTGSSSWQVWELELGGHTEFTLRLENHPPDQVAAPAPLLRESIRYRITAAGLELRATCHLASDRLPQKELLLDVEQGVHIATVQLGDRTLPLARSPSTDAPNGENRVQVILDEPLTGTELELKVLAIAPLEIDRPWDLPRIRPVGTVWQEGEAFVEVVAPLMLSGVRVGDGVETRIEPLAAPEQGEMREVQFWRASGRVQVHLSFPPREIVADVGTSVRFSELVATGSMVVDLQARQGTDFVVQGVVAPGWTVDSVQTDPPEVLDSFATQRVGPRQDLSIRLRHGIPTDKPVRISLRAHRRAARPGAPIRADIVRMVTLQDVRVSSHLFALSADPPLRIALAGDRQLQRLDSRKLTARQAEWITASPSSLVFLERLAGTEWSVTLNQEQPRFSAKVDVVAEITPEHLLESYELQCEPDQSFITGLLVHVSRASPEPMEWTLVGAAGNRLVSKLLPTTAGGIGGESWELSLSPPVDRPFVVRATRRQTFTDAVDLSFVSLPEAASQSGTLRILASDCGPLDVQTRNVQPIATDLSRPDRPASLRGAYRFAPSQEVTATIARQPANDATFETWVWRMETQSRQDANGNSGHETRLFVENAGRNSLAVRFPADAIVDRLTVDDESVPVRASDAGNSVELPLPKGRRFPLVRILYRTRESSLGWCATVHPGSLQVDVPCLERRTTLWVPPAYSVLGSEPGDRTWDERLFGMPFWRRNDRPFDVFRPADWAQFRDANWKQAATTQETDPAIRKSSPALAAAGWPWKQVAWSIGSDEAECGWAPVAVSLGDSLRAARRVYHRGISFAATAGLLLAAAGVCASLSHRRREFLIVLAVLAAIVLLIPADFVAPARALFLGALLGLAWRIVPSWKPASQKVPEPSTLGFHLSRDVLPASTTSGAVVLLALLGTLRGLSQDRQSAVPAGPGTATYNVLIPVDGQQQPKGDYLFLPSAMYDALNQLSREPVGGVRGAWIESAEYRVTLSASESGDTKLSARELVAEFALRTFHPVTRFRLPFRRDQLRIVEATLDGSLQPLGIENDETWWTMTLNGAGAHRLRITARPLQVAVDSAGEFLTPIPRSPRSRLVVHAPGALDRIVVPAAVGSWSRDDVAGEMAADLSPGSDLRVNWEPPAVVRQAEAMVDTDAAERLWLHVQNNALTLNAQVQFSSRNGSLGQVTILADPRLRLLPVPRQEPIAAIDVVPGDRQQIRCWLDRPYRDVTVQLSFAWNVSSGLGTWRVPLIEAQASRRAPTWLGVSVAEGNVAELTTAGTVSRLAPTEFLSAWQAERDPPQQAFSLGADSLPVQLEVRPVPSRITAQEHQDVYVGGAQTTFEYEAVLSVEAGRVTNLRLLTPASFEPREIIVLHDDANRLLRWSRVSDQELSVFLTQPLAGEVRLLVRGDGANAPANRNSLSLLALSGVAPIKRELNLYQQNDVRVEVVNTPNWQLTMNGGARSDRGRLVASLLNPTPEPVRPVLELLVKPNRPRVEGSIVTMLTWSEDQWKVAVTMHLNVQQGAIDELRMIVPAEFPDQIQRDGPGDLQIQPATGEEGRILRARFLEPVERSTVLTLTADLGIPVGVPIHVPELRVLDWVALKRYVVLPRRLGEQRAVWETSGLQSADLPAELANASIPTDASVFQVVGPRPRAMLREVERAGGTSQVHLADYQLSWTSDLTFRGLATFYLEPSHLADVEIEMPEAVQPFHFRVAGLPVAGRHVAENRWSVPVGPEFLPQLVEVLFTGELVRDPRRGGEVFFSAPVVSGIPTEQTLWSIQGPPNSLAGRPTLAHTDSDIRLLDSKRIQTAQLLRQRGYSDATQASSSDRDAWRANWDAHIQQISQRTNRHSVSPGTDSEPDAPLPAEATGDLVGLWLADRDIHSTGTCSMLRGATPRVGVQYQHEVFRSLMPLAARITLLALVVAGANWLRQRTWLKELWRRCPQLLLAAVGLVWWLTCVPSLLGLIVLLVSAASALRSPWKTHPA